MNTFNTTVSFFENVYDTEPKSITLDSWINLCSSQTKHLDTILKIQRTSNIDLKKRLKKQLPLITPGGVMIGGRKKENVQQRTGWLAFDIDQDDHPDIKDWEQAKQKVGSIVYTAYCGLTSSGQGLWGLIKISDPEKIEAHFTQLEVDFAGFGLTLDDSKGKNPNDARSYSYDPYPYINENFKIYDRLPKKQIVFRKKVYKSNSNRKEAKLVEQKLDIISQYRIDLAPDYDTYLKIGFALADEFGESGREYFHAAVCHSLKYNRKEADYQYTNCLKAGGNGINIATFYYYCKINNIN